MRASETLHVKLHKRRKNKEAMANARTRTVLIVTAIHSEVKLGLEFVCTCCHRMMYRKSVVACRAGACSSEVGRSVLGRMQKLVQPL